MNMPILNTVQDVRNKEEKRSMKNQNRGYKIPRIVLDSFKKKIPFGS